MFCLQFELLLLEITLLRKSWNITTNGPVNHLVSQCGIQPFSVKTYKEKLFKKQILTYVED